MPSPSTSRLQSATPVERWSLANAVALLAVAGVAWGVQNVWPLFVVGVVSLGALMVVARAHWTPSGRFGWANGVTVLRIGLLGLLPGAASAGALPLILLSLTVLVTDGLDGWLARRHNLSSKFGAFFDKETDALFLLLLCALATFRGRLGPWILGAGLLRYSFVLLLFLLPRPEKTEQRSTLARYVYGAMIVAVLSSFLPYPALYRPLAAVAGTALALSFARSVWRIVPRS